MFSYKSKNYALLDQEGNVGITGAALKSRGLEPFQRHFIATLVSRLLHGEKEKVAADYEELRRKIAGREIPLAQLAKTETLSDSPDAYRRKLEAGTGRRAAAFELALRSGRSYQAGDTVTYYMTGEKKNASVVDNARLLSEAPEIRDENTAWYLHKLDELHRNFAAFL